MCILTRYCLNDPKYFKQHQFQSVWIKFKEVSGRMLLKPSWQVFHLLNQITVRLTALLRAILDL